MKQIEAETKIVEIKSKWASKINELTSAKNDIKEQRVNLSREIAEKQKEHKRLQQQEHFYNTKIDEMYIKRNEELSKFKSDMYTNERKLSEVSDFCLVNELVARGFSGDINHSEKSDDFMAHLKAKFAGDITHPNISELITSKPETQDGTAV